MANIAGQQVKFNNSALLNEAKNAENQQSTIFFTYEENSENQKIILNGVDYSGVKTVQEGSESGKINVDGQSVNIHGWDDKANKSEAISNIEFTPENVLRVKKINDQDYTAIKTFDNIAFTGSWNDLKNIPTLDYVPNDQKGVANGVATLDNSGKVPSTQLPSFVDDVIEIPGCYERGGNLYRPLDDNGKLKSNPVPAQDFNNNTLISSSDSGKQFLAVDYNTSNNPGIYVMNAGNPERIDAESGKIYVESSTGKTYRFASNNLRFPIEIISSPGTTDSITEGDTNKFVTVQEKNSWNDKVDGPSSSTNEHVAIFDGATGKVIKDSGFTLKQNVESTSKLTDQAVTQYTYHYNPTDLDKGGNNQEYEPQSTDAVIKKIITDERGHIRSIEGVSLNVSNVTNAQSVNNKVNSWSPTVTNDKYPSEKLVKDSLDTKADKASTLAGYGIQDVAINNGQISIGGTSITPYVKPANGIPESDLSDNALNLCEYKMVSSSVDVDNPGNSVNWENYKRKLVIVSNGQKQALYAVITTSTLVGGRTVYDYNPIRIISGPDLSWS